MRRKMLQMEKLVWWMLAVSALLYGLDYFIFGKGEDVVFGLLGNLAFLPLYVLFVTLIIERILKERERVAIRQKLNMVIGVFFSEVGNGLLCDMKSFAPGIAALAPQLKITAAWEASDFIRLGNLVKKHDMEVDYRGGDLERFRTYLLGKREFMLRLLENPNLLEHDDFSDLLWAVFHLIEELEARASLSDLPPTDLEHLAGDMKRVYTHLLREWVFYMHHLRKHYPYLFSLAMRRNPFNPEAHAMLS